MRWKRLCFIFFLWIFLGADAFSTVERQMLRNHNPPLINQLRPLRALGETNQLDLAIVLPLQNREELTNLLKEVIDRSSPNFRHYLTPEQFAVKFGPAEQDYQRLIEFAKRHGFAITGTHSDRSFLRLSGSVGAVEEAFHIHLHEYQHPTEPRTFYAPDVEPSVDTTVPILEVKGLDNYDLPRPMFHRRAINEPRPAEAKPNAGSGTYGAFTGKDFRAAYVPGVTLDGTGQKVGLFELDGYYTNDLASYAEAAQITNALSITNVLIDGADGSAGVYNGEVALDIEMVMSMAPGAQIVVYEGNRFNPASVIDTLRQMATNSAVQQLSSSWAYSAGPAMVQVYQQMILQGQSFYNSSGDLGAYNGSIHTEEDDPYLTLVGGTSLTTSSNGAWQSETVWNITDAGTTYASGGGISPNWTIPTWQQGISMISNGGSATMRNFPDVSMVADNVQVIADNGQSEFVSGTSISAPLWAGFTALVNQKGASEGKQSIGFINPIIYAIGKGSGYATAFHDVTSGNNINGDDPTNFSAVAGYDLCTGWGSPMPNLIDALLNYDFVPTNGWAPATQQGGQWSCVASSADGTILAAASGSGGKINISTSSGATWRSYGPVIGWRGIACSGDGSKMAAAPFNSTIYLSTNFGVTWLPSSSPAYSWESMASSADGTKLASGSLNESALAVSTNSGAVWFITNLPGGATLFPVAWSGNGNILIAAHGWNIVSVSTNYGASWVTNSLAIGSLTSVAASGDGTALFAAGDTAIFVSTNFGKTWQLTKAPAQNWSSIACSADGRRVVACSIAYQGLVCISSDGGLTWSNMSPPVPNDPPGGGNWGAIAVSSDGSRFIAACADNNGLLYTGFFPEGPSILGQPSDQTVQCGRDALFSAQVRGTLPLTFQWFSGSTPLLDGSNVSGSATPSLLLKTALLGQSGAYSLNIVNPYGSTNTITANLNVQLTNPPVLTAPIVDGAGNLRMSINGFAGWTAIETSTNLINWETVTNVVLTNSSAIISDQPGTNFRGRFYRARVQ